MPRKERSLILLNPKKEKKKEKKKERKKEVEQNKCQKKKKRICPLQEEKQILSL